MRIEPREVLLNLLAGAPALRDSLRRLRDRGREPDHAKIVDYSLERLRVRRAFIGEERIRDRVLLEIGSGPEVCLALLLLAAGAKKVINVEIEPYGFLRDERLYRMLGERAGEVGLELQWPPRGLLPGPSGSPIRPDPEALSLYLGRSATRIEEPDGSVDVTFSVAVLEHVRREAMPLVARELHRLTRPGGVGYHRIDLVDHYHRRTEPFRFLCYGERAYRWMYGRRGSSSNRLRMDDIERIFRDAGFPEVRSEDVRRHEDLAQFLEWARGFDPEFQGRDVDLLRVRECMLALRR